MVIQDDDDDEDNTGGDGAEARMSPTNNTLSNNNLRYFKQGSYGGGQQLNETPIVTKSQIQLQGQTK